MNKFLGRNKLGHVLAMAAVDAGGAAGSAAGGTFLSGDAADVGVSGAVEGVEGAVVVKRLQVPVYYKAFAEGTGGHTALKELVAAGKLDMSLIEVDKNDKQQVTWKRKGATLGVTVPVLAKSWGGLTGSQQQHVQEVLEKYFTDKQRPLFDALEGKEVDWVELLSGSYSQRKVAVKITAEMITAASLVLHKYLQVNDAAKGTVVEMAKKKFSSAVTRTTKPEVLERLLTLVLEAYAAYETDEADEASKHEAVFGLWADNLQEALQPADESGLTLESLV